ncbi:uncharacterized protein LOC134818245 [Bolinopsis microptera]|uniref:uncharacterized protein LOC134818245 n=1 Tax=Bolinopsis microptera TaxID=2820187 RepID=UPI00307997EE
MNNLQALYRPELSPLFLIRCSLTLISVWYVTCGASSYILVLLSIVSTLYLASTLLSKYSILTSLKVDTFMESWTYPQDCLRNFFVIRDFKPFPDNLNYSVISRPIYILLDNVIEKFVLSWHAGITTSKSFPRLVRLELVQAIHQVYYRCGLVNKYDIIEHVMGVYLVRLEEVVNSTSPTLTQIQHTAALNHQSQDQYVRAICDLLMRISLSKVNYECEALRAVLREILSSQLLNVLVETFSDPSTLYKLIVELVEDDDEEEFSGISDDDKEFLRNKPHDKKCFEIISEELEEDDTSTTIQFASLDCSPGERSNKFRIPKVRLFGVGITRFAVYVIEYSDKLWNPDLGDQSDISIHLLGRRFNEFAALHERLLKDKTTKPFVKKVNFPSKEPLSSFPFNRLDREFLSSRRDLFTQYLNEICQYDEVLQSENMKEFLGYNCEEITVFKAKSSSFIESKIGKNITKMLRSFSRGLSLSDTRAETCDESLLDISSEMFASYKDSIRKTKKLTALSHDHAKFLKAPPSADISDTLEKYIREKMEAGEKGPCVPSPCQYYNRENTCVSIRDSQFASTLLHTIQLAFSKSETILGTYGLAQVLTTVLRLPINRYFINKINTLTSENYWFVYLTKLNQLLFELEPEEGSELVVGREEFVRRIKEKVGRERLLSLFGTEQALLNIADSLADQVVNKAMLFLIVDHFLGMFVPELEFELKSLYR